MSYHPGGTHEDDAEDDAAAADPAGTVVAVVLLGDENCLDWPAVLFPVLSSSLVDSLFTQYPTPSALCRHSQEGLPAA